MVDMSKEEFVKLRKDIEEYNLKTEKRLTVLDMYKKFGEIIQAAYDLGYEHGENYGREHTEKIFHEVYDPVIKKATEIKKKRKKKEA